MTTNKVKTMKKSDHSSELKDGSQLSDIKKRNKDAEDDTENTPKSKRIKENVPASSATEIDESNFLLDFGVNVFIDEKVPVKKVSDFKKKEAKRKNKLKRLKKKQKRLEMTNSTGENSPPKSEPSYPLSEAPEAIEERKKLKLEKKEHREKEEDSKSNKALQYLEKYENDKASWKFNKNTDIFLRGHCLDQSRIPDSHFPFVLEYFRNAKGNAMSSIKELALACLSENVGEDKAKDNKKKRKRAKKLVSLFD